MRVAAGHCWAPYHGMEAGCVVDVVVDQCGHVIVVDGTVIARGGGGSHAGWGGGGYLASAAPCGSR